MGYKLNSRRLFTGLSLFALTIVFIGFQNFDYVEFVKIQKQEKDRASSEERELRGIASVLTDKEKQLGHQLDSWIGFSEDDPEAESTSNEQNQKSNQAESEKLAKSKKAVQWQRLNKVNWNISDSSRLSVEVDPRRGDELTLTHSFNEKTGLKLRRAGQDDQTQVEFQMKW